MNLRTLCRYRIVGVIGGSNGRSISPASAYFAIGPAEEDLHRGNFCPEAVPPGLGLCRLGKGGYGPAGDVAQRVFGGPRMRRGISHAY